MKKHKLLLAVLVILVTVGCEKEEGMLNSAPVEIANARGGNAGQVYGSMKDIDGNTYRTVKIGNQVWMVDNLKVTRYRNGDPIPNITDPTTWSTASYGAWCYNGNQMLLNDAYGKLYNWLAISDSRKLAPRGWHVPTAIEVNELINFLGGPSVAGGSMKETGSTYWALPNTGATNSSRFSARPGGHRHYTGLDYNLNYYATFWTSTIYNAWAANFFSLSYDTGEIGIAGDAMTFGCSVRLIKD